MIRVRLPNEPGLEDVTVEAETEEELEAALRVALRVLGRDPVVSEHVAPERAPNTPWSAYADEAARLLSERGPLPLSDICDGLEGRLGRRVSVQGVATALHRSERIKCRGRGRAARYVLAPPPGGDE